jgi:hypothetical protein
MTVPRSIQVGLFFRIADLFLWTSGSIFMDTWSFETVIYSEIYGKVVDYYVQFFRVSNMNEKSFINLY